MEPNTMLVATQIIHGGYVIAGGSPGMPLVQSCVFGLFKASNPAISKTDASLSSPPCCILQGCLQLLGSGDKPQHASKGALTDKPLALHYSSKARQRAAKWGTPLACMLHRY